jgi:hypothetical protein
MRRAVFTLVIFLTSVLVPAGNAQVVNFGGCSVDFELLSLPDCAVSVRAGRTYVSKEFAEYVFSRPQVGVAAWPVKVGHRRLASTNLPHGGWAYFDRTGLVVVQNVATMDNGASAFYFGLVRVSAAGKWGLSNVKGKLVVPLEYDGILEFDDDQWLACKGCVTETSGEYHFFRGGAWVSIDRFGKLRGPAKDPTRN